MNNKQQAILARQTDQITTMEAEAPEPINDLAARTAKSATILKSTLCQADINLLGKQISNRTLDQQEQVLKVWYNWADEVAAIAAQNSNGHFAGNVWEDTRRAEANQKRDGLVSEVSQISMRYTIYEMVTATIDQLSRNPTKIIIWESETNNNEIYLTPDGLGNLFLVYLKNGKRVAERVAYVPGYALEHNVWHLDFSPAGYDAWVERCKSNGPAPKRQLQGGFLARETEGNYGERRYR